MTVCGPRSDVAAVLAFVARVRDASAFRSAEHWLSRGAGVRHSGRREPDSFVRLCGSSPGVSLVDTTDVEAYGHALANALNTPRAHRQLAGYTLHDTADRYMSIVRKFAEPLRMSA